jgi:hypothetical protein
MRLLYSVPEDSYESVLKFIGKSLELERDILSLGRNNDLYRVSVF